MEYLCAKIFSSLLIGYLIGSISPSYFLGKLLKGVDIRREGTGNAGTENAYRVLGPAAAVPVALFDLSKGILALWIAQAQGLSPPWTYGAASLAVVGHIFPFYLRFRGGEGVATATGLMLYFLFRFYWSGILPWYTLLILSAQAAVFRYIAREKEIVGKMVLPLLLIIVNHYIPLHYETFFVDLLVIFIFAMGIYNIVRFHLVDIKKLSGKVIWWRFLLRPLAVLFLVMYLMLGKETVLTIVGIIALVFISLDLIRLSSQGINVFLFGNVCKFFKEAEKQKFSSMSLFLVASFITILIFPRAIAFLSLLYLIFGDMFGKFFGIQFGRRRFLDKTLKGSLAHLAGCLTAGYVLSLFMPVPVFFVAVGSLATTIAEAAPLGVDDNLIVPLLAASVMTLPSIF